MAQIQVYWCAEVAAKFPQLAVSIGTIGGVSVERENEKIRQLKQAVYSEVRAQHDVEKLKDNPVCTRLQGFLLASWA
jgi:predicted TIM-barrel fold metal-dependent hydrolase